VNFSVALKSHRPDYLRRATRIKTHSDSAPKTSLQECLSIFRKARADLCSACARTEAVAWHIKEFLRTLQRDSSGFVLVTPSSMHFFSVFHSPGETQANITVVFLFLLKKWQRPKNLGQ
jgi:hypothetical protein